MGPKELMSPGAPYLSEDGRVVGGTIFERIGLPTGIRGARAYSLSCTQQRSRQIIGPTAGGKVYGAALGPSQLMRQRVVKVRIF